jgi:hypothetical protein
MNLDTLAAALAACNASEVMRLTPALIEEHAALREEITTIKGRTCETCRYNKREPCDIEAIATLYRGHWAGDAFGCAAWNDWEAK